MLWNNPSVHCVDVCHYDCFNKQTDWPIAEWDKLGKKAKLRMMR